MKSIGSVEALSGSKAIIKIQKNDSEKENCNEFLSFGEKDSCNILVNNTLKAKQSDKVEILMTGRNYSFIIKMLYFMPLIMLFVGFLIGLAFDNTVTQFAFAISLFAASIAILAVVVSVINKRPKTVYIMNKIIKGEN